MNDRDDRPPIDVALDTWRERGAGRLDPARWRFIEALARRAAGQTGEARRLLDERLGALLADYAERVERAAAASATPADATTQATGGNATTPSDGVTLAQLNARLAASPNGEAPASSWPELALLDYFRQTWARVRTEKQLRRSQDQVPRNAGPLNSSSLVHRSLALMRELSPGYLEHFLSYVDALSWLEQLGPSGQPGGGPAASGKEPARGAGAKKPARGKAR